MFNLHFVNGNAWEIDFKSAVLAGPTNMYLKGLAFWGFDV